MKKALFILSVLVSTPTLADETCGDMVRAYKSNSLENVVRSYFAGIRDMSYADEAQSKATFDNAPESETDKSSKQWQLQRALMYCNTASPSEPLAEVIKATQLY